MLSNWLFYDSAFVQGAIQQLNRWGQLGTSDNLAQALLVIVASDSLLWHVLRPPQYSLWPAQLKISTTHLILKTTVYCFFA